MKITIQMSTNGHKIAKVSPGRGKRGFSIPTNGNLSNCHRLPINTVIEPDTSEYREVSAHVAVASYSERQKALFTSATI